MSVSSTLPEATRGGLPPGYVERGTGSTRLMVHEVAEGWTDEALASSETLHAWAETAPDRETFSGRGTVHSVPAPASGPDGRARWAVRHYRRGGAVASRLGDRYLRLGRPRPFRELLAAATARARQIRTPAVLAAAVYPSGLYYRGDLVTEVVPGAVTLAEALSSGPGSPAWEPTLSAAGLLLETLAAAGVHHVDLNAHNVVFEEGDAARPWVLDLDRAKVVEGATPAAAARMRARLARSLVKVATPDAALEEPAVLAALEARR